jgi:hypothetical protein
MMPERTPTTRRRMLQVDFFTYSHRLSTQVNVYMRPLADQLNDPRVSWIELEIAYISRIERPAEIIADYAISTLRKEQILFAMITGSTEGALKKLPYTTASGFYLRLLYKTWIALRSFEITGNIEWTGKLDLHTLLVANSDRFMPIQSATAVCTIVPSTPFSAELILVNKDAIEMFCAEEKGKAALPTGGA